MTTAAPAINDARALSAPSHADPRLDDPVGPQQRRWLAGALAALDEPLGQFPEEPVPEGETPEKDAEHRGGRLALRPEQSRHVPLPGDLVGEGAESCENGEQERQRP